jgi:hypothetical protein
MSTQNRFHHAFAFYSTSFILKYTGKNRRTIIPEMPKFHVTDAKRPKSSPSHMNFEGDANPSLRDLYCLTPVLVFWHRADFASHHQLSGSVGRKPD